MSLAASVLAGPPVSDPAEMSEEAAPPASPPAEQPGGEGEEASPPPFKPPCLDLTEFPLKADYFEVRVESRAGWGLY